jgi:hydrogenase maturation protease
MPVRATDSKPRATALVICLGNEHRGDDGFGPLVARRLAEEAGLGAKVVDHRGDALALIDLWHGCNHVVLVDAIALECAPGTVLTFDLSEHTIPLEFGGTSSHALGPGGSVEIARALGILPRRIEVVAVAADDFDIGDPVSPPVAAQVEPVVRTVRAMIGEEHERVAPES